MTSSTYFPRALFSVDVPDERSNRERPALTESILLELSGSRDDGVCRRLRQEAVLLNLSLADGIASRYAGRGVDRDDLVQVARVGLLKAVVGYRAGEGAGFVAYAGPTIAGEIKRYFRDYVWMVRPPRRLQELHSELRSVEPRLRQRLSRAPSAVELANALGVPPNELSEALTAAGGYCALSLDVPNHAGPGQSLGDALPDGNDPHTIVERAQWLRPALAQLTNQERRVVELRFIDDLSQVQIGRHLGLSQMQVSRLLAGILGRLRADLEITATG
ncbi:MAG: sigma-70 family RNA polymerase sigma factor [Actinomycetota bacterium]